MRHGRVVSGVPLGAQAATAWAIARHWARGASRTPLFGYAALATLPVIVTVARGGRDLTVPAGLSLLACCAGLGFALDDAARPTIVGSPLGWHRRHLVAGLVTAGAMSTAFGVVVALGAVTNAALGPISSLWPEASAAAACSLACAASRRPVATASGLPAALVTLLGLAISSGMQAQPGLQWLPVLGLPQHAARWWTVAAAAAAVALLQLRDPAACRPGLARLASRRGLGERSG